MIFFHFQSYNTFSTATGQPDGSNGNLLRTARRSCHTCCRDGIVRLKCPAGTLHHSYSYLLADGSLLQKHLRINVQQTLFNFIHVRDNATLEIFRGTRHRDDSLSYTTDNAAMIGIVGYYKYLDGEFCDIDAPAFSKVTFK